VFATPIEELDQVYPVLPMCDGQIVYG